MRHRMNPTYATRAEDLLDEAEEGECLLCHDKGISALPAGYLWCPDCGASAGRFVPSGDDEPDDELYSTLEESER